ncbi:MAG: SOS response-associated peptidase [Candidatus Competibacterales bacterium]|nr:SOS response-associated peptidase [Candidatus Competibacterales bacterium]
MCGRFALYADLEQLRAALDAGLVPSDYQPRYNIAPTQAVLSLRRIDGEPGMASLRWGLIPGWSRGPDSRYSMINARAESIATRPAYRGPFRHRRCLVPASGFYEWQTDGQGPRRPWFVHPRDDTLLLFAGLWERWEGPDGPVDSCTIVTTTANDTMKALHERMPVILDAAARAVWLDPESERDALQALLRPAPEAALAAYPVGRQVNNPRHDRPDCVTPAR